MLFRALLAVLALASLAHGQGGQEVTDYTAFAEFLALGNRGVVRMNLAECTSIPASTADITVSMDTWIRYQQGALDSLVSVNYVITQEGRVIDLIVDSTEGVIINVLEVDFATFTVSDLVVATCQIGEGATLYAYGISAPRRTLDNFEDIKAAFLESRRASLFFDAGSCDPENFPGSTVGYVISDFRHFSTEEGYESVTARASRLNWEAGTQDFGYFEYIEFRFLPDDTASVTFGGIDPTSLGNNTVPQVNIGPCPLGPTVVRVRDEEEAPTRYNSFQEFYNDVFLVGRESDFVYNTELCSLTSGSNLFGGEQIAWRKMGGARYTEYDDFRSMNNYEFMSNGTQGLLYHEDVAIYDSNTAAITQRLFNPSASSYQFATYQCPLGSAAYFSSAQTETRPLLASFEALVEATQQGKPLAVRTNLDACGGYLGITTNYFTASYRDDGNLILYRWDLQDDEFIGFVAQTAEIVFRPDNSITYYSRVYQIPEWYEDFTFTFDCQLNVGVLVFA